MNDLPEKLRIGVVGTGSIATEFHLPAILRNPRAELAALGNLRRESLEATGSRFGVATLYTDLDRMADDRDIDAIINALPNYLHAPVSIAMLRRGKHVLCEKPMALTAYEAAAMIKAAEESERVLAIAYPWRFDEEMNWLRRVVESGILGTVFSIEAHSIVAGAGPKPDSWLRNHEFAGGGALIDVGVHGLNSISYLFGDELNPQRVFAHCSRYFGPGNTEDTATAILEFANGMTAFLRAGWQHPLALYPHGALEVFGVYGYARIFPPQLICSRRPVPEELAAPTARVGSHIDSRMYEAQLDGWIDSVVRGVSPRCTAYQGLRDMQVIDAAYRSAAHSTAEEIG